MSKTKRIIFFSIVALLLIAFIVVPLIDNVGVKEDEETVETLAEFSFNENLAMYLGNVVTIKAKVFSDDVDKLEVVLQDSVIHTWLKPSNEVSFEFNSSTYLLGAKEIKLNIYQGGSLVSEDSRLLRILSDEKPLKLKATVVALTPHNTTHFTQGLEFNNNVLYESTGQNGESKVAKIDMKTGEPLLKIGLDANYFGEGITILGNRVYQITWKEQRCFIYNKETLQIEKDINYAGEGWGLCNDGKNLVMSDGSERIYYRNPETFELLKTIEVYDNHGPRIRLNELEYINGKIYANVWMENIILVIDPSNGKVLGEIDCSDVVLKAKGMGEVLNGIAYNPLTNKTYLTGKFWSKIAEVTIK